ncbi:unnamed protein product [Mytilus coruscus]|uniref:VWFA domain-containing protein n=1 Tax=Mytilus coruscus TaxID=42192 RepID=A0A6J8D8R8_MYTCO|nr:unnamed protein product [Mytilus coruscus]
MMLVCVLLPLLLSSIRAVEVAVSMNSSRLLQESTSFWSATYLKDLYQDCQNETLIQKLLWNPYLTYNISFIDDIIPYFSDVRIDFTDGINNCTYCFKEFIKAKNNILTNDDIYHFMSHNSTCWEYAFFNNQFCVTLYKYDNGFALYHKKSNYPIHFTLHHPSCREEFIQYVDLSGLHTTSTDTFILNIDNLNNFSQENNCFDILFPCPSPEYNDMIFAIPDATTTYVQLAIAVEVILVNTFVFLIFQQKDNITPVTILLSALAVSDTTAAFLMTVPIFIANQIYDNRRYQRYGYSLLFILEFPECFILDLSAAFRYAFHVTSILITLLLCLQKTAALLFPIRTKIHLNNRVNIVCSVLTRLNHSWCRACDISSFEKIWDIIGRHGTCQICSNQPADIGFLIDESGSVGQTNFNINLDLVRKFVDDFDIGNNAVKISAFAFHQLMGDGFYFNCCHNKTRIKYKIDNINFMSGGEDFEMALTFANSNMFQSVNGARNCSLKILMFFTDGQSTQNAASLLHQIGVLVYAVGVGSNVDRDQLNKIATNKNYVFMMPRYSDLVGQRYNKITSQICSDVLTNPCERIPQRCQNNETCVWTGGSKYTCLGSTDNNCPTDKHIDHNDPRGKKSDTVGQLLLSYLQIISPIFISIEITFIAFKLEEKKYFQAVEGETDVVFILGNNEIHLTKSVLKLASPVFRSMFTAEFKEKGAERIPLPDKTYGDFVLFLRSFYPGEYLRLNVPLVKKIVPFAREYNVKSLLERIKEWLEDEARTRTDDAKFVLIAFAMASEYGFSELYTKLVGYLMTFDQKSLDWHREYQQLKDKDQIFLLNERCKQQKLRCDGLEYNNSQYKSAFEAIQKNVRCVFK